MSLEAYKSFFEIGGVVLLFVTFVFGAGALYFSNRINEGQAAQLRQFDKDLTDAKLELGKQQERAANADSRVAGLENDVADAKTEMAKQQTRAATAEKDLIELRERIKPRLLTNKQSEDFLKELQTLPHTPLNLGYTAGGGDEGLNFLKQFMPLFKEAGWKIPDTTKNVLNHLDVQVIGVAILVPGAKGTDPHIPAPAFVKLTPELATLRSAFKLIGIDIEFVNWYPREDDVPELVIGSKPNP